MSTSIFNKQTSCDSKPAAEPVLSLQCDNDDTASSTILHSDTGQDEDSVKPLQSAICHSTSACDDRFQEKSSPFSTPTPVKVECEDSPDAVHDSESLTTKAGKQFQCHVCQKLLHRNVDLVRHMKTHAGEKPYKCSMCGQRFAESSHRKVHMETHKGEKLFVCPVCGRGFCESRNVRVHMNIHTGEKPFECTVCGQKFNDSGNLKVHTRTHTGEKPFECTVCGWKFTNSSHLKRHFRTHTGEKPYECELCGKRFAQTGTRHDHIRRKHRSAQTSTESICLSTVN